MPGGWEIAILCVHEENEIALYLLNHLTKLGYSYFAVDSLEVFFFHESESDLLKIKVHA